MTCNEAREALSDLYDGRLPQSAQEAVERHLQGCAACRTEWAALQRTVQAVSALGGAEPSPGFAARVRRQAEAPGWWGRAARWLFLPVRVKVPLHAAALLVLGLVGLLVYEQSPQPRKGTVPPRAMPPAAERRQAPTLPPPAPEAGKPEAVAPPPLAEPRQAPAVPPGMPTEQQTPRAATAPEKATEAEPPAAGADALRQAEGAAEVRRDQMESAQPMGKIEEAPVSREPSRQALAARTPDALYSAALTDLAAQRYPQALSGFRAFIAQYPQDPKVPYARLALGDAQAAGGHPLEAIQEYETLIQRFPQSPLVPTALLRQAQARLSLGDPSGCTELQELADRFPQAPEAAQARDLLTRRCR
jgi:tol-pal system protein YbgF